MSDKKRPTFISIEGDSHNISFTGVDIQGDIDAVKISGNSSGHSFQDFRYEVPNNDAASWHAKPIENGTGEGGDLWYKKPIGIVGLSVFAALVSAAAIWAVKLYF